MTESTIRFASEDIPWMMEVACRIWNFHFIQAGFRVAWTSLVLCFERGLFVRV
jgi:hypothetical protein